MPDKGEYKTLLSTLKKLNYRQKTGSGWARDGGFTFDLFPGKKVFITELLDSPLDPGRFIPIRTFKKLMVGALNDHDLIISKMFRGTDVDIDDCLMLIKGRGKGFDLRTEQMMKNLDLLLSRLTDQL